MRNGEDIAKLKSACYSRLEYGKSRGTERKVWLSANRVLDSLYALEKQRDELCAALIELDEAYCRAGGDLTREERFEDRQRLMNARAALAKARGEK